MSPSRKRISVEELQSSFDVSERRACDVVDQPRSSQRYEARVRDDEAKLVARMLELVRRYPRYGYRFITAKLSQEGWRVNFKRVYRLWRQERLKAPRKARKKRRLGHSGNSCARRRAKHKDHVWTWDFIHDRTATDQPLKRGSSDCFVGRAKVSHLRSGSANGGSPLFASSSHRPGTGEGRCDGEANGAQGPSIQ